MIRPTLRAVLLFGATVPLALILLAWNPELWPIAFDFSIFLLVVVAIDALLCTRFRQLDLAWDVPARIFVGGQGAVKLTVTQRTGTRAVPFEVLVEQRGDIEPPQPQLLLGIAQRPAVALLPIIPERRGEILVEAIWLRWRSPFALAERIRRVRVDKKINVLPDIRGISSAALQFLSRDAVDGIKVQLQKGDGAEFDSLREHAAGLDNRHIDWKRSAKHLKLLSKEFRTERNHLVVIAFDTGHLMAEPLDGVPRLDHAIHAGLLLSWISLRSGDFVGSFGFDARVQQFIQPSRGMPYFAKLHNASAQLTYQTEETNFTLGLAELNFRLKRRALVVLFTEFIDTTTAELLLESLQRMANRHAVIFVTLKDPMLPDIMNTRPDRFQNVAETVVGHDLMRERAVVLERLSRLGVHCLEVPPRGLAAALVNRYLTIKGRGLL